jgi:hypothetical protein
MPDARTGCSRWTSTSWWGGALVGSPPRGRSPNDASLTHLDDALSNLLAIKKGLQVGWVGGMEGVRAHGPRTQRAGRAQPRRYAPRMSAPVCLLASAAACRATAGAQQGPARHSHRAPPPVRIAALAHLRPPAAASDRSAPPWHTRGGRPQRRRTCTCAAAPASAAKERAKATRGTA